jgi:hypothetical protein
MACSIVSSTIEVAIVAATRQPKIRHLSVLVYRDTELREAVLLKQRPLLVRIINVKNLATGSEQTAKVIAG